VPVHNEAISFMFILGDFPPSSPNCDTIRIPRLSSLVRGVIDKPGFSFGGYMKTRAGGEVLGSEASSRSFASSNCS